MAKLREAGIEDYHTMAKEDMLAAADVVILTVSAQHLPSLLESKLVFPPSSIVLSFTSGVSDQTLEELTGLKMGDNVFRISTCGHDVIEAGKGMYSVYPGSVPTPPVVERLMNGLHLEQQAPLVSENQCFLHSLFCTLPAGVLVASEMGQPHSGEILQKFVDNATFLDGSPASLASLPAMYAWALKCQSQFKPSEKKAREDPERLTYIRSMYTKGGLTEAVCEALLAGASLDKAYATGWDRCKKLTAKK